MGKRHPCIVSAPWDAIHDGERGRMPVKGAANAGPNRIRRQSDPPARALSRRPNAGANCRGQRRDGTRALDDATGCWRRSKRKTSCARIRPRAPTTPARPLLELARSLSRDIELREIRARRDGRDGENAPAETANLIVLQDGKAVFVEGVEGPARAAYLGARRQRGRAACHCRRQSDSGRNDGRADRAPDCPRRNCRGSRAIRFPRSANSCARSPTCARRGYATSSGESKHRRVSPLPARSKARAAPSTARSVSPRRLARRHGARHAGAGHRSAPRGDAHRRIFPVDGRPPRCRSLRSSNVNVHLGGHHALKGTSRGRLQPGRTLGVRGCETVSGKSTLLRVIRGSPVDRSRRRAKRTYGFDGTPPRAR